LPKSWKWVRFNEVVWCFRGHNPPKSDFVEEPRPGYVRFVQITDFKTDTKAVYVPESPNLKRVHKGEIIMAAYRHIGKLSRNMEGAFNVALCKVLEIQPMDRDFIEVLIGTDLVKGELLRASERGHIPSMHSDHLLSLFVPVPPIREQHRIVAKVDQLMALCDDLEAKLQKSQKRNDRLMEAVVAEMLAA
jgi:type I restriction enzyme S subunit